MRMHPLTSLLARCLLTLALLPVALWAGPVRAADVQYSTAGVLDTPATQGGDRDGWGTEFITRWENTTCRDVVLEEFGWPCGGWWAQFWYVWIIDSLPQDPYTLQHYGTFVAASEDDTEYPPRLYTYVDVSDEGIVVPAGASMYFGYGNPGLGGQIAANGVATYSWYEEAWDLDGDFGRTALLQFKGSFTAASAAGEMPAGVTLRGNHPNPFNPQTTISFALPRAMNVSLDVVSLTGRRVRSLVQGSLEAGGHEVFWNGTDQQGRAVSSGIYLVRLVTEDGTRTGKMLLVK